MSKKCYRVSVELEVLVVAESPEEARTIARVTCALEDDLSQNFSGYGADVEIARYIPGCWELDSLVYHDGKGDITVAEAMKLNDVAAKDGAPA